MNTVLWIVQGTLAVAFFAAGARKLVLSPSAMARAPHMAWTRDVWPGAVRLIGVAELAGAALLVLPGVFGAWPALTPAAALGAGVLMAGAVFTHRRRGEPFALPLVLGFLSLCVVAGRW